MIESIHVAVEEIRLQRFRAFENTKLQFADLTFLLGRNGAGKSSILDAVEFLRESVSDSLENTLDRRGGLHNVQRANPGSGNNPPMGIAVVFSLPFPEGRTIRALYGFEIQGKSSNGHFTLRECFKSSRESSFERINGNFKGKDDVSPPAGNLVLPLIARSNKLWNIVLDTIRNVRAYEFSPAHMVAAPDIGEKTTLVKNGANAGDVLKALEGTDAHRWIVERLAHIVDGISDVRAESLMGRRTLNFVQQTKGGKILLDASQVSQGTLRGLGILLALKQKPQPAIVLVDEIENSVHPNALSVLLDAALACSDGVRVVLTSHSPEVLTHPAVSGERVRVIEWKDGLSNIYPLSDEVRQSVNEIDTVGWMLRSNTLWTGPEPDSFKGDLFALGNPAS